MESYSSKLFDEAVAEFSKLPGIGKRTATRLVLYLLKLEKPNIEFFGNTIISLANDIKHCRICHNISDTDICSLCSNPKRINDTICIVENIKDVIAIENTQQFKGLYHILGGILSPMEGIGPADLNFQSLEKRIENGNISELILALSPTMEGDTTSFYLYKKFSKFGLKITTLARGVSFGDEIEFADEITLGRSILNRQVFDSQNL
ncbi:MAG: recombination mediator RecR [Bacteroidales bacterium]